jgi:hypothetical protein
MPRKIAGFIVLVCCMLVAATGYAEDDKQSKADAAVANILFDYDFGSEFATYRVSEDGFVDIIMAKNTPANVYSEILNRLQNHPDIDGVMPSRSGPACSVSNW